MWSEFINSIDILFVCIVFFVGVASPGPSNLAIMAVAMQHGRVQALILSLGIVCGSMFWGILAGFGLASILATYSNLLIIMKITAGLYLLWLAFKSARSAFSKKPIVMPALTLKKESNFKHFLSGILLHLTNPKAIFVWLSIVSIALPSGSSMTRAYVVVFCCSLVSIFVFTSYALLFSTKSARQLYLNFRRGFDGLMTVCFSYAGIRMLFGKI